MNCADLHKLLLDVLDDRVDGRVRHEAASHLERCPACRRELDEHQRAWRLLECLPGAEIDAGRLDAMADAVLESSTPRRRGLLRGGGRAQIRRAVALAAAAAIVLAAILVISQLGGGGSDAEPDRVAIGTGQEPVHDPGELPELLKDPEFLADFEIIVSLPELEEEVLGELLDLDDEELLFLQVVGEVQPS